MTKYIKLIVLAALIGWKIRRGLTEGAEQVARREHEARVAHALGDLSLRVSRTHLQLSRMEQAEHNRRVLEQDTADHHFLPKDPSSVGGNAVCDAIGCLLPRRQHPYAGGETVIGTIEMGDLGRINVRDWQGSDVTVYWSPPEPQSLLNGSAT